jgi:hypothetical protein
LQHKITKGERCGKVRFGFNLAADGEHLEPNPTEQEAVALVKQLQAEGLTYRALAAD